LDLAIQEDSNLKNNGNHDTKIESYKEDFVKECKWIGKIDLVLEEEIAETTNKALGEEGDVNFYINIMLHVDLLVLRTCISTIYE